MSADRDIDGWLAQWGISAPTSRNLARALLETEGLTRPGKTRLSEPKVPRAEQLLLTHFYRVCIDGVCQRSAATSGRVLLLVEPRGHCEHCGGSNNRRAEEAFLAACLARAVRRVVVVGGSPSVREELEGALGAHLELRMVDGTAKRTGTQAQGDLEWADLVLIWGSTELNHKVSNHYTQTQSPHRHKLVHVVRRGVAALLEAGVTHLRR